MFWYSLKSQYFSRQNHIYNIQHLFLTIMKKRPTPTPGRVAKKQHEQRKGTGVCVDSGRECGGQASHPYGLLMGTIRPGWCLIKRTISLQKPQGTTHNPNKVAVHSRTGDFRACYPWVMGGVRRGGGGSVRRVGGDKDLTQLMPERTSHHWLHELQ